MFIVVVDVVAVAFFFFFLLLLLLFCGLVFSCYGLTVYLVFGFLLSLLCWFFNSASILQAWGVKATFGRYGAVPPPGERSSCEIPEPYKP